MGMVLEYSHVLVANPNVAASNAKELIALAKSKPGQLNFASGGNGATNHVSGEWFKLNGGVDIVHVPYKGNGPAITDLLADRVQLLFTSTGPVEAHLKSGKLKAVAVTGKTRASRRCPTSPRSRRARFPATSSRCGTASSFPPARRVPIVDRLNADLRKTMASPDVKEKLASIGGNLNVGSPEEFAAVLRDETVRWAKLAKDVGIKLDQ